MLTLQLLGTGIPLPLSWQCSRDCHLRACGSGAAGTTAQPRVLQEGTVLSHRCITPPQSVISSTLPKFTPS